MSHTGVVDCHASTIYSFLRNYPILTFDRSNLHVFSFHRNTSTITVFLIYPNYIIFFYFLILVLWFFFPKILSHLSSYVSLLMFMGLGLSPFFLIFSCISPLVTLSLSSVEEKVFVYWYSKFLWVDVNQ